MTKRGGIREKDVVENIIQEKKQTWKSWKEVEVIKREYLKGKKYAERVAYNIK